MRSPIRHQRTVAVALIWAVAALAGADYPRELAGKVVKVTDGDTLTVLVDKTEHKIRLAGIDAPEAKQPFGSRAKQALSDRVFGKTVQVEVTDKDRYGRLVGVVTIDGRNVNVELVSDGMAWWYRKYAPGDKSLKDAEMQAKYAKRGLWADADPVPPWEWRKQPRKEAASR